MPSTYKLTYFDAQGRAEPARLIFAAAGKSFEDVRVKQEDWPTVKGKMPQGTMPVLEVDGHKYCQSLAVVRFLAREFNLYGKGNRENTIVDMILDTAVDMLLPMLKIAFNPDKEEKEKQLGEYMKNKAPEMLGYLEKLVIETGKKGFAVGSSLTAADLVIYSYVDLVKVGDLLKGFPRLEQNRNTIAELPRIKKYLADRKPTAF